MNKFARTLAVALTTSLALAGCSGGGGANGGAYPDKTIRLITHSPAGSGGDLFVRPIADALAEVLGVDVRVENRPGGLTAAAMKAVKDSDPDGYTLTAPNDSFLTAPLTDDTGYSLFEDLTPIARIIVEGEVLFVRGDSPYKTIDDLMAAVRESPQKWAMQGATTAQSILVSQLIKQYGIKVEKVPFTDSASTVTSVLNGDTVASIGELDEASELAETGKIRILAATTPKRIEGTFSDIPTLVESGFDVSTTKSRGIAGPAGLPADVVTAVETAVQKILAEKSYQELLAQSYQIPSYLGSQEYTEFLHEVDNSYREALATSS